MRARAPRPSAANHERFEAARDELRLLSEHMRGKRFAGLPNALSGLRFFFAGKECSGIAARTSLHTACRGSRNDSRYQALASHALNRSPDETRSRPRTRRASLWPKRQLGSCEVHSFLRRDRGCAPPEIADSTSRRTSLGFEPTAASTVSRATKSSGSPRIRRVERVQRRAAMLPGSGSPSGRGPDGASSIAQSQGSQTLREYSRKGAPNSAASARSSSARKKRETPYSHKPIGTATQESSRNPVAGRTSNATPV